jgi:hypothetical protein
MRTDRGKRPSSKHHRQRTHPSGPSRPTLADPLQINEALIGKTEADNTRHGVARAAFMNALLKDERVRSLFQSWQTRFGLVGRLRALESVFSLSDFPAALENSHDETTDPGALQLTADDFERAADDLGDAIRRLPAATLAEEAAAFVANTLGLTWAWLALEIVRAFLADVWGQPLRRFGRRIQIRFEVDSSPPAPALEIPAFTTRPGERFGAAVERLNEHMRSAFEKLAEAAHQPPLPRGRVRGNDARNAEWFYRVRIRGETVSALAREYHARRKHVCSGDDRKTIREGIQAAERVLALGQYELLPPPTARSETYAPRGRGPAGK